MTVYTVHKIENWPTGCLLFHRIYKFGIEFGNLVLFCPWPEGMLEKKFQVNRIIFSLLEPTEDR